MLVLELDGVSAYYGAVKALDRVSLRVEQGALVALLGANGAGKSTTLRAITGLVRTEGSISYRGSRIDGRSTEAIVRLGVTHVPEGRGTFAQMTVEENLQIGGYPIRDRRLVKQSLALVYESFPTLSGRRGQQAGSLSGGEQQMLAIGRALMGRPALMLIDELSLGLAPQVTHQIFTTLSRLRSEADFSLLLVDQNANLALAVADYAYVLTLGRVALEGETAKLLTDDAVRASYLGY